MTGLACGAMRFAYWRPTALRDEEKLDEARKLLYEVLAEGNEEQVGVARNILEQLDED